MSAILAQPFLDSCFALNFVKERRISEFVCLSLIPCELLSCSSRDDWFDDFDAFRFSLLS